MGSVDPVYDMSNRHVSHGRPMDVAQSVYTPSPIEWNFHDLFILLLSSALPTVRQFLLKQTQLKCVMFGRVMFGGLDTWTCLEDSITLIDTDDKDLIDTVKVLKCYSGIAT